MKKYLKKVKIILTVVYYYMMDAVHHLKFSLTYRNKYEDNRDSLRCAVMLLNHQLEKAQTYLTSKDVYGKAKLNDLLHYMDKYITIYGSDELMAISFGVLKSHFANPHSWKDEHSLSEYNRLKECCSFAEVESGVRFITPDKFDIKLFEKLLIGRKSCRIYSDEEITDQEINNVVSLAQLSPSACNRQPVRVHCYRDKKLIEKIILAQKADVNWCLNSKVLFVITINRRYYRDYIERNQGMFDAGLFSMNLSLALHSVGIASCFKMAQKGNSIDKDTKNIAAIPQSEDICVLICTGKYPHEPSPIAISNRISIDSVLTLH